MKRYKFKMRDKYDGSIFEGNVDGEDWREAWIKLSPLMKAGHKIVDIEDLDEPKEVEASDMSILHLVKKGQAHPDEEEIESFFQVTFMLLSGEKIDVCARPRLVTHINEWFNSDDEELPPTISLMVEGTVMSLDRGYVGGVLVSPLILNEDGEDEDAYPTDKHDPDEGDTSDGDL